MTAVVPPPTASAVADPGAYVPRLPVPTPTPLEACDAAVAELRAAADRWAGTNPRASGTCSARCCARRPP